MKQSQYKQIPAVWSHHNVHSNFVHKKQLYPQELHIAGLGTSDVETPNNASTVLEVSLGSVRRTW